MSFQRTLLLAALLLLAACAPAPRPAPEPTPPPSAAPTLTPTVAPSPTATLPPTPTALPVVIRATVWQQDPQVPVLIYHNFLPDRYPESTGMKMRLGELRGQLQRYYDAGFSLVSLEDWLSGNLSVPPGRKPLILTIDDAFLAQQLSLTENGDPSPKTGVGVIWQFAQEHPDFGFAVSLSAIMGDKLFANIDTGTWWITGDGWEDALGRTIAWALDNNVAVHNHTYTHVLLDRTAPRDITAQLAKNDETERTLLARVQRSDLNDQINNVIVLPEGIWPADAAGVDALTAYTNPEGRPVEAILEAGYDLKFLSAPYATNFDRFHIPRMMAGVTFPIDEITRRAAEFPAAAACDLSLDESRIQDVDYLTGEVRAAVEAQRCPPGVYVLPGLLLRAQDGAVSPISIAQP